MYCNKPECRVAFERDRQKQRWERGKANPEWYAQQVENERLRVLSYAVEAKWQGTKEDFLRQHGLDPNTCSCEEADAVLANIPLSLCAVAG